MEEIVTSIHEKKHVGKSNLNIEERLLHEAATKLDEKQSLQINATKEKSVDEILAGMSGDLPQLVEGEALTTLEPTTQKPKGKTRRRQKMHSTPVVGGGLCNESNTDDSDHQHKTGKASDMTDWKPDFDFGLRGHKAEIIDKGESYNIRIDDKTLQSLRSGFSGDMMDGRGLSIGNINIQPDASSVVRKLSGYVRSQPLALITEHVELESDSEISSVHPGLHDQVEDESLA